MLLILVLIGLEIYIALSDTNASHCIRITVLTAKVYNTLLSLYAVSLYMLVLCIAMLLFYCSTGARL
jgi:hypothetical protein